MAISSAKQYRRLLYALLPWVSILVSACAFSNEGAVDYRRAESFSLTPISKTAPGKEPLHLSPLLMKDVATSDSNAVIEQHDKISIRLRDGFLRSCNEKSVNPLRGFRKNCEIAILFKAFELGNGQDFKFQPGAEREARLVYFSHDVDAGQHFNLHNMAVYGPIEYKGRPLALDIYILELDAEDAQTSALLKTLASIGATAYAPAAPVLGLLEKLGASLLNSGTDDTEFRYSFVLDSSGGYSGTAHATAEAGDYAFIREENRLRQTLWSNLYLDHNTGRIWTRSSEKDDAKPYTTNTYLTVQVLKNAGTDSIELDQNTFGAAD
jgi:hypothetical protein